MNATHTPEDNRLRIGAIVILIPFALLTALAIATDGSNGFANAITHNWLAFQIWLDLVIAMVFWAAWVIRDAKSQNLNPWGWVITSFIFGAFVPLIYTLVYRRWPATPASDSVGDNAQGRRILGALMFLALAAVTVMGLVVDGTDVPGVITHSWSNTQIWVDLVIVILLWMPWMVSDARANQRNPWGWVVAALLVGSFSPLLYLMIYGRWPASHPNS